MPSVAFGQTLTGRNNKDPYYVVAINSPVGTTVADGSRLICKAGGVAWFVSPPSTYISSQWANGQYNSTAVGDKCCISEWGTLNACLSANVCNYVATQWFVPSAAQLQNPGYLCRTNWAFTCSGVWWSSTETSSVGAFDLWSCNGGNYSCAKTNVIGVVSFRCVTY